MHKLRYVDLSQSVAISGCSLWVTDDLSQSCGKTSRSACVADKADQHEGGHVQKAYLISNAEPWDVAAVKPCSGAALLMQRLAWRADTCQTCEGATGEDLSGGYFEAGGSYLKFSYPLAFTITQLAWGVVEYRDGYAKVLQKFHLP